MHVQEENKGGGAVQFGLGSTGYTYKYVKAYVVRMRPRISLLENVPDLMQDMNLEDGDYTNDVDWIVADMAAHDFFAQPIVSDRKDLDFENPN